MISRIGSAVDSRSTAGDREAAVVDRLHGLAPHLDGQPDPAFRAATRARLVAMAAVRSPEPEPVSPLRRLMTLRSADAVPAGWRTRLTAGLAGAALTVTALSTLVALSTDARPGDILYGLKRGTEQTQLALAGDSRRGETLLDHAGTRLDELTYLVSEDATALPSALPADGGALAAGADLELVLQTLDTMDAQTADGAAWMAERAVADDDARPLDELAGWTADQSAGLAALEPDVPEAAHAAFDASQELLSQIGARTAGLETALNCPSGPATAGADRLGPVPGTCAPAAPGPVEEPATSPGGGGGTPSPVPGAEVPGQTGDAGDPQDGTPGGGTPGGGTPGGGTPGGGTTGQLPGGGEPPVPDPGTPGGVDVPTPSLPLPTGSVTPPGLPEVPLPGQPTPSISVGVDVCLGPITLGDC